MELGPKTKIDDLLKRYPFLLGVLLKQSSHFKLLENPVMRKTVGKMATVSQAAALGGLELDKFLADIAAAISGATGEEVRIAGDGAGAAPAQAPAPTDKERQEVLKGIIKDLHAGVDMEVLKGRFHDLVQDIDPSEIARMEQRLIDEGMPQSEIKRLCDLHVELFKSSLEHQEPPVVPPGHPVHTFMRENRAAEEILSGMTGYLDAICGSGTDELFTWYRGNLQEALEKLAEIDRHYLRKENQLFPVMEAHGLRAPTEVMWAIHDDIRDAVKKARKALDEMQGSEALATLQGLLQAISDMIYKEEHILFPLTMETLSDAEWLKVRQGEEEIGYSWITPEEAPLPEAAARASGPVAAPALPGLLDLSVGRLSPEQINLLLTHLPVEVSFVDENDEVRYYSQVTEKIFPRSPGVIGRKVQNCHPPKSLHMVQKIVDEFRAGARDVADFWIEMKGRFIYIRYFAVRDAGGAYRGTLEVVQDVTGIRGLTGQKRLLDWE